MRRTRLPIWCSGVAAPPSVARLTFADWQTPIGCGGVAIFPDDVIVADQDGAVVIPKALVGSVTELGGDAELLEEWILDQVNAGRRLPGLYPPDENAAKEFSAWKASRHPTRT